MKVQVNIGDRTAMVFDSIAAFDAVVKTIRLYEVNYSGELVGPSDRSLTMKLIDDSVVEPEPSIPTPPVLTVVDGSDVNGFL